MTSINLTIDNIYPCISSRGGIIHQGQCVKCHTNKHRFLVNLWIVPDERLMLLDAETSEQLAGRVVADWLNYCTYAKIKQVSSEMHISVKLTDDGTQLAYNYQYHKLLPEQDLIDHFHPFRLPENLN